MAFFVYSQTDLPKKRVVLSKFICRPETFSYTFNMSLMVCTSSTFARQNSKLSSAKNNWEIFGPPLHRENPYIFPSFIAFWISPLRPSEHKSNKYGYKWSPCLKPLDGTIWPLGSPLTLIEKDTELIHS